MKKLLITIDGPAGAGKTTSSRMLAEQLGYICVDTGALYRAIAVAAMKAGVAENDDAGLENICRDVNVSYRILPDGNRLLVNHEDVTDQLRTPRITMLASAISARPVVRKYLLDIQRELGAKKEAVFEGRDMGTVVFPDADLKFFLQASLKVRAMRRYLESPPETRQSVGDIEKDMKIRDENDSTRAHCPLIPADDAIVMDSTDLSIQQLIDRMVTIARERIG